MSKWQNPWGGALPGKIANFRNSHDKSLRLGLTAGLRVFVCSNMAFSGDFTPVLAKHTKSFNLVDTLSVGVDRIQRNFEPMQRQVESWRQTEITDAQAKLILYSAFVDGKLDAPKGLLPEVHRHYFEPQYPEFSPRTMWSLSNAFTSAFKKLDPIPQFKATAKLGEFLSQFACMIPAVPFTVTIPELDPQHSLSPDLVQPTSSKPVYGQFPDCRK